MSDKHPNIPGLGKRVFSSPVHFLAFGFGSGLAPVAPGTFGTLAILLVYLTLLQSISLPVYLVIVVLVSLSGVWICGESSRQLGVHDHSGIVWDEFAGFLLTMVAAPAGWHWALLGFGLFRLFDIWKPWPIHLMDSKIQGGLGIMLDDIVAGLYAMLCLQLVVWVSNTLLSG